ncbi:PP2C family protein-serine/threonine phosphatase [Streptomyces sp. NBC_01304]|uniref:PP2C family protein-serine/threonine phosphatase n=1 Tax=Streptomyces sp. NBC_01304 TaxID=2903818 RepID=UPI002E156A18|nr:serine/threonine-protein phosphatase [Streptomyces sp. NBC_01304]
MKSPRNNPWCFPAAACLAASVIVAALSWETHRAPESGIRIALMLAGLGVIVAVFVRQSLALRATRSIADTVQHSMLQPPPSRVGGLRTEVRYVASAAEATVGGDVYEVVDTPFGVRLLLGDVMGKGLPAVRTAMDALGAFRELAPHEKQLPAIAQRMDACLTGRDGSEEFVTALLLAITDGEGHAELVCCGHPPPLLIRAGRCTFLDAIPPAPPLGLFHLLDQWCRSASVPLSDGDRLLLYTDGVTEARDARGTFYPLAERATLLYDADPAAFLDALTSDLLRHGMGQLKDDAALLLVDYGDIRSPQGQPRAENGHLLQGLSARPLR